MLFVPHCVRCGYNLTGLATPRCPECGEPFDEAIAGLRPRRRPVPDGEIVLWLTLPPVGAAALGLVVGVFYRLLDLGNLTLAAAYLFAIGTGLLLAALRLAHRVEWGHRIITRGSAEPGDARWPLVIALTIVTFGFYMMIVLLLTVGFAALTDVMR